MMQSSWQLDGELISDISYKDWTVLRTISGNGETGYELTIQMVIEKDFTGGWSDDPQYVSLMKPRRFRRLDDAIEFAETRARTLVDSYLAGYYGEER